mgnify:CR=1 FL=1
MVNAGSYAEYVTSVESVNQKTLPIWNGMGLSGLLVLAVIYAGGNAVTCP